MNRVYFEINEKSARTAHEMMLFSDYQEGSRTAEYRSYVDKTYDLADEIVKESPEDAERVYSIAERYSKKMADNINASSRIGCMCPSVMICGPANFPVKKKERQNAAADRNYQEWKEIQKLLDKMRGIANGKDVIKSGDADAVERLEKKLETLKAEQEKMKAANKAIRMKDIGKGDAELVKLGFSEAEIESLRKPDFCGRIGYPDYALRNNNANIHRVEGRLKKLKKLKSAKESGKQEYENRFFKVVENTELMRLQLLFDGKPDADIRDILKSNGFRWSPRNRCWQRQLTDNAKYALKQTIKELESRQEV